MEISGLKCSGCGRRFVGGAACPTCGRRDGLEAATFSGRGSVYSYSRVHVPTPKFQDRAPYLLALVELAEGPRITGQIESDRPEAVAIGQALTFSHEDRGVLFFKPTAA